MCPTTHENGFHVARIVHGALGRAGVNPRSIRPLTAAKRVEAAMADHCAHPHHGVVEAMAGSWFAVGTPEGWEPVEWAVQRFRWVKRPRKAPGRYATNTQRDLATLLWHVFSYLPTDRQFHVYAATRTIARFTGYSHEYAAQTLNAMAKNGILETAQKHSQACAKRYFLTSCPVDR